MGCKAAAQDLIIIAQDPVQPLRVSQDDGTLLLYPNQSMSWKGLFVTMLLA